jgi:hypothetical protein
MAQAAALGDGSDMWDAVLDEKLIEIQNSLLAAAGKKRSAAVQNLQDIFDRMADAYEHVAQLVDAKQKFLIMLKTIRGNQDQHLDATERDYLVAQFLLQGMEGRCADGQASFINSWFGEYQLSRAMSAAPGAHAGADLITRTMQLHVGILIGDCKKAFLQRHCTPFASGQKASDTNEARTEMQMILTQVLRLPLSLPGSFSPVRFPDYALHAIDGDPAELFSVTKMMGRYLFGGTLKFRDDRKTGKMVEEGDYVCTVPFEGLSLRNLIDELRRAMLDTDANEARAKAPTNFVALPGLLPLPTPTFVIPERIMMPFVRIDPVLSPWWATFEASYFTQSNIFFDAAGLMKPGGKVLRNIMRDAAVVRILEVAGYVSVPDGFYASLTQKWKAGVVG